MPAFTQKHYVALADLIHKRRLAVKGDEHTPYANREEESLAMIKIESINELVVDLVKLFQKDNPKFRDLIFIESCNRDMHES